MKTFEKTEEDLLRKCLYLQLQKEIKSGSLVIFNFANIGNVCASKKARLIIHKAFFCSKFMQCLQFRF